MNENIDLTKILKDCPKGFKLYSIVHGEVTFSAIENGKYPICVLIDNNNSTAYYSPNGKIYVTCGECVLLPSKDQRDWSKFTAPWYKKERFNPATLQPFDRVLVRNSNIGKWKCTHFSYIENNCISLLYMADTLFKRCIPYDDNTKHLVGTTEEAPEYYRYWEG